MKIISYDLGTGGVKAALYRRDLSLEAEAFIEYYTSYPGPCLHEQRPADWWRAVAESTRKLLRQTGTAPEEIAGTALSGASLVAVPMDKDGRPLLDTVPIWSDMRAGSQAEKFFRKVGEREWYQNTGNGFPPGCYPLFKLMWMKEYQPALFRRIAFVLGSKDYINFLLTGNRAADYSYASGTGAYSLKKGAMIPEYLHSAGIPEAFFPPPRASHEIVGAVTPEAAAYTGLPAGIPVMCGGVDNACMALGAVGAEEGRAYVSLGSSAWIPLNSRKPVLDFKTRPYVFAHIQEQMYTSAYSIFAGGSALRWVRDLLYGEIPREGAYAVMDEDAVQVPPGAGGVLFHPGLAGGTAQDGSVRLRGAYMGLRLGTTRQEMVRAAMEGIAMNLLLSLRLLRQKAAVAEPILFCGGGSRSAVWMQIFADIFDMEILKTNIDQTAASLGAAAIAARGLGWWKDYSPAAGLHQQKRIFRPNPEYAAAYKERIPLFEKICEMTAELGEAACRIEKDGIQYD